VGGAHDVWTSLVHGGVDHVCSSVEKTIWAAVDDFAIVVNQDQV